MKLQLLTILLLLTTGCGNAQIKPKTEKEMKQEVAKLEELIREKLSMAKSYTEKPAYYLQINKSGCRLLLKINDTPVPYSFIKDDGQSMLYPINDLLLGSGKHTVTIEVYPRSYETVVTKDAWVNVKVVHYKEKLVGRPEPIDELTTPTDIGTKKLPIYRDSLSFEAMLPFDFNYLLTNARDLRKVPDLEQKVVAYYNNIRQMMIDRDYCGYVKLRTTSWPNTEMNYLNENSLRKSCIGEEEFFQFMCEPIDWIIQPIENYDMIVCGGGKIVYLRHKKELNAILRCEYYDMKEHKEQYPDQRTVRSYRFIALYMPNNGDTLDMLY